MTGVMPDITKQNMEAQRADTNTQGSRPGHSSCSHLAPLAGSRAPVDGDCFPIATGMILLFLLKVHW